MYFFYRLFTAVGMILLAPYYALRGWRRGEPPRAAGALGSVPPEIAARVARDRAPDGAAPARSGFTPYRWAKCSPQNRSSKA